MIRRAREAVGEAGMVLALILLLLLGWVFGLELDD